MDATSSQFFVGDDATDRFNHANYRGDNVVRPKAGNIRRQPPPVARHGNGAAAIGARERDEAQAEPAHVARLMTMGELAASIAHEVNQPLSAIVSNAEACLRWLAQDAPDLDRVRSVIDRIARDGHDAGCVIRSMRTMLRKATREFAELDINQVVGDALHLLRGELRRRDIALETDLVPGIGLVLGERVQLQQVVVNLAMNAIEAMDGVPRARRKLRVTTARDSRNDVVTSVEDLGAGLDAATMPRIFDAFFTTKCDGLGMGLSICRSIVEAHRGRLWATPRQTHGVVFRFVLPAAAIGLSDAGDGRPQ